jgi:serine/threonine protein phosphatase PrpC
MTLLSVKSIKGRRDYMEDYYNFVQKGPITVAMVCDGHGGYATAQKTTNVLPNLLLDCTVNAKNNIQRALAIKKTILEWVENCKHDKSGSTLTGVLINDSTIFIYNIGDSRTNIQLQPGAFTYRLAENIDQNGQFLNTTSVDYSTDTFFFTSDHDSSNNFENQRVRATGGKISDNRLNGILSVTRALGDYDVGLGISGMPTVSWLEKSMLLDQL